MAFSNFLSIVIKDLALSQVLQRIRLIIEEITEKDILDGILLQAQELVTGSQNVIAHKLGRDIRGYIITQRSADCRIWDDQLTNTEKAKYLKLQTSANVTVNIWVF